MSTTIHFLTGAELARRLNLYPRRFGEAVRHGILVEDARAGRVRLFDSRRISELEAAMKGAAK